MLRRLAVCLVLMTALVCVPNTSVTRAEQSTLSGLFKISTTTIEGPAIGCVSTNCPTRQRSIPAYLPQTQFPELAEASEIAIADASGGCAVIKTVLRCWGINNFGELGNESTEDSLDKLVTATDGGSALANIGDVDATYDRTCVVTASGALRCVGKYYGDESSSLIPGQLPTFSKKWRTLLPAGVRKVVQVPLEVCVIKTNDTFACSEVSTFHSPVDSDAVWEDSGFTSIRDVSIHHSGSSGVCLAGATSYCRVTRAGDPKWIKVENADNAESVYLVEGAACFYRLGALWCARIEDALTKGSLKARLVAAMPKPLGMIKTFIDRYGGPEAHLMFIFLTSGILLIEAAGVLCDYCYTSPSGVISKLSAAEESTITAFNSITSINGITNRLDYVPMTVVSGTRSARTSVSFSVLTESGEPLRSATVRWNAPDAPGTVSNGSNQIATNEQGVARATLVSGPVSFTIRGGTVASGATLQSAVVTTFVPASGQFVVKVPDPPEIVDRTVKVIMPDGTPVPSAQVTVRDPYLAYAYRLSGTDVAAWGSQQNDAKGYFAQPWCAWCFVPPPAYITGADGTITLKTFDSGTRSSTYDVDVIYDDGSISQRVEHTLGMTSDAITLPIAVRIVANLKDSDPSSTIIDVPVSSRGSVELSASAVDISKGSIASPSTFVEEVCDGMDSGGLWQAGLNIDNLCRDVSVSNVRAFASPQSEACRSASPATTGSTTKFTFCPTKSTKFRIRGKGSVATLPFCVVVDAKPCTSSSDAPTKTLKSKNRFLTIGRSVSTQELAGFFKLSTKLKYSVAAISSGSTCRVSKGRIVPLQKGVCSIVLTERNNATRYLVKIVVKRR